MTVDSFWQLFLKETGKRADLKYGGEIQLGEDSEKNAELTALVLAGKKTASCSSLYSFDIDMIPLPKKNSYYILTDFCGNPVCVIRDTNVSVLSFDDVTWELASREEENTSIEDWRESRADFFEEEAAVMGYTFSKSMPVVFEEFEVVYK